MKVKTLIFLAIIGFLTSCNSDVEDAIVEGYCYYYNTEKPFPNTEFYLENWYYKGGDFDGYGDYDVYKIKTDENGYFLIKLPYSAYIQLDIVDLSKSSATRFFAEKYIVRKKTNINFYRTK